MMRRAFTVTTYMQPHAELKRIIEDWLTRQECTFDWSRSINPPGEQLHLMPFGMKLLITDSAIEDNSPLAILDALVKQQSGRFGAAGDWILRSNLRLEAR